MALGLGDTTAFEVIEPAECFALLATGPIGRIAVSVPHDAPLVVPVNYVVDGRSVLFRSGFGRKLRSLLARRVVSFEVDDYDRALQVGWSVLARGRGEEIRRRDAGVALPEPWHVDDKPYLIRLTIDHISGRRICRPDLAT